MRESLPSKIVKRFWIIDGHNRPYDLKEELKARGAYFDFGIKAWCIDDPPKEMMRLIESMGLRLQFRSFK